MKRIDYNLSTRRSTLYTAFGWRLLGFHNQKRIHFIQPIIIITILSFGRHLILNSHRRRHHDAAVLSESSASEHISTEQNRLVRNVSFFDAFVSTVDIWLIECVDGVEWNYLFIRITDTNVWVEGGFGFSINYSSCSILSYSLEDWGNDFE